MLRDWGEAAVPVHLLSRTGNHPARCQGRLHVHAARFLGGSWLLYNDSRQHGIGSRNRADLLVLFEEMAEEHLPFRIRLAASTRHNGLVVGNTSPSSAGTPSTRPRLVDRDQHSCEQANRSDGDGDVRFNALFALWFERSAQDSILTLLSRGPEGEA
jgi:hypothetical protein